MSSMHRKALVVALLAGSAAVAGTITGGALKVLPVALQASASVQPSYPQPYQAAPSPYGVPSRVSEAVAQWNALRQSDNLPFSSYSSFLLNHRGWPGESAMRKSAERAINLDSNAPSDIAAYFRTMPPLTATGWARYAFALQALGRTAEARDAARQAWYGGVLPQTDEQRLLESFAGTLTPADHDRRLDVLLANRDITSAMRILPYASAARRPLYEARLALQTKAPDAAAKLAMVAASAETDPGLLLDRANWLRDGAQEVAARSTLAQQRNYSTRPADPAKWMEGMLVFARSSADDRQWTTAYQIASQVEQAYPAGTDVSAKSLPERDNYTSLAWLGGSAALQKLNRPADALRMFELYARASQSPQTKTKGWYWAGRAAEAVGDQEKASGYYRQAAAFADQFYGQLAADKLGQELEAPEQPDFASVDASERQAFNQRDLVAAARMLGQMGSWRDQSEFLRAIAADAKTSSDRLLAAQFAREINRPDLGVMVARRARQDGSTDYAAWGFPQTSVPPSEQQNWTMIHAISRQESQFDRQAVSHAGALGLMQLMPATARQISGKLGADYSQGRLTGDPQFNAMLGSAYFSTLMDIWGGSYPLAIASYNAGAGNVRKWVAANGDPRLPGADMVDWIEQIPFSETRNYVQRVLENAVVYDMLNPNRRQATSRGRLSYYLGKGR